ncbi:MAG: hypothetical protein HZA89_08050 [Verrucomicrobia bacterium]|nr:hypothetical protein [Verrucomicrobiota bacterium]
MTFHNRCCRHFGCKPGAFEDVVFWHCLFSKSRVTARLMHALNPAFFSADRKLIRSLAGAASYAELESELVDFRDDYIPGGHLREEWRMRVSTTKIARLAAEVFQDDPPGGDDGASSINQTKINRKIF